MEQTHLKLVHDREPARARPRPRRRCREPLADPRDLAVRLACLTDNGALTGQIVVRRYGRRNGPRVLVLAGSERGRFIAGEHGWWRDLAAPGSAINLNTFAVLGIDIESHESAARASTAVTPQLLHAALERLNLLPLQALIGCGDGAAAALQLARFAGDEVQRLCLIGPTLDGEHLGYGRAIRAETTLVACGPRQNALAQMNAAQHLFEHISACHVIRSPFETEAYLHEVRALAPILRIALNTQAIHP